MCDKIVYIKNVKYKGKVNKIKWNEIENSLKSLIGKKIIVDEYNKEFNIGSDFPDEFVGSKYTEKLMGALIKVKANISAIIVDLVKNATNEKFSENKDEKHYIDAFRGWNRYDVSFAIPIYNEKDELQYNNEYSATMIVRLDKNGKDYLYDFVNIKKGKCNPHG